MKAERPPHHTPVMRDDLPVTNADEITECMKNLTFESVSPNSKDKYNILVDETKNEEDTAPKDNIKDITVEEKDTVNEAQEVATKSSPKKEDIKEKEKPKAEEEPLGELCARGPEPKHKWTSQTRSSVLPYLTHPQSNATLTNGGRLYYNPQQTQLSSDICYHDSSIGHSADLSLEYNFTQHSALVPNDNNEFINNIHEASNVFEALQCPEFQQATPQSPAKPEIPSIPDGDLKEIINDVVCDQIKFKNVFQDLLKSSSDLDKVQNLPDPQVNISPYSSYGNASPISSPQVVPKSQLSPYSTSSGSPQGPSSPNLYANTPTFSPNMPSPRGYPSDDSSNHMYAPTPYCNSMLSPQMQRPLSSCSSTSCTTNNSNPDPYLDLDAICKKITEEGKSWELKSLEQELDNTCSQACLKTEALNMPSSLPTSKVPLANSPVVITTIFTQSSTMITPTSNGSNQGVPRLRKILPKPSENSIPQQCEPFLDQNQPPRQHVSQNKMVKSQRKPHCTAKDQLLERCSQEKIQRNWARVQAICDEVIAKADDDGDTCLMILVCDKEVTNKPEQLYALVERCKSLPDVLCARNKDKLSALYMACVVVNHDPLVAMYIAEAMIEAQLDLNAVDHEGSTLIHLLCKAGDKCAEVLNQLLSLCDSRGEPCFDINKSDYEGRSPLHLAVDNHNRDMPCHEIVKVLLKNGADVLKKDGKQGSTALHFAVDSAKPDPNLINTLCNTTKRKYELVNALNYKGDTPLHVAMACGSGVEQQTHNCILECLMGSGASRAIRNQNGKAPLELAPEQRKAEIKKILDKYSVK